MSTIKIVHEDARGGPYIRVYVNDEFASSRPLNPGDEITTDDIHSVVVAVARLLGADVEIENLQVLYDARGNRVDP